jgi:hypothetical protein
MSIIPHLHSRPGSMHDGEMKSTYMFITAAHWLQEIDQLARCGWMLTRCDRGAHYS